jgi:hypothetical protein
MDIDIDIEHTEHKQLINEAREKLEEVIDSGEYSRILLCVEQTNSSCFVSRMLWEEDYEDYEGEESEERK